MNFCRGTHMKPTIMMLLPLLFIMCILMDNHHSSSSTFLFRELVTANTENNNNYQQWSSRRQQYNDDFQRSMFETSASTDAPAPPPPSSSEEKEEGETTESSSLENKRDDDDNFWQDDDDDDFFDSIRPLLPKKKDVQKQIHAHIIKPILSSLSSSMEGEEHMNTESSPSSEKEIGDEDEGDKFWQDEDFDVNSNEKKPIHHKKKKRQYIKRRFLKPLLSSLSSSSLSSLSNGRTTTSISIGITIRNHKRDSSNSNTQENSNTNNANFEADDHDGKTENKNDDDDTVDITVDDEKKRNRWSIQITGKKTEENNSQQKGKRSILADDEYELDDEEEFTDDDELDDLTPLLASFLKKRGEDLFHAVASKVCSEETHQALKTIQRILSQFSDHGVVDVFSLYPTKDIILSTLALSRLQRCYLYTSDQYTTAEKDASESGIFSSLSSWIDDDETDCEIIGNNHFKSGSYDSSLQHSNAIDKNLLSDLAHYAVFANAAYGWKGGAFTGQVHVGDLNVLLKTTGIDKQDVVATQWHSKTHRPAFFLVRDLQRKKLVLSIRGTLSARDILTDLCCTADDFGTDDVIDDGSKGDDADSINGSAEALLNGAAEALHNTFRPKSRAARAHHGMLESAKGVAKMTRKMIASELAANPKLGLVIVGHSLGGGVAAVLGAMWQDTFPGLAVYAYGCPCVGPLNASPTTNDAIISIVGEGDPFSCLSLGHLADVSSAISQLCRHHELRDEVLRRTRGKVEHMSEEDLFYCYDIMEALRKHMNGEKFFPPGRILHMGGTLFSDAKKLTLEEVSTDFFRDLKLHPRMLDLSRHAPIRYESALRRLWIETIRNEEVL